MDSVKFDVGQTLTGLALDPVCWGAWDAAFHPLHRGAATGLAGSTTFYGRKIRSCNSAGALSYSFTTVEVRVP